MSKFYDKPSSDLLYQALLEIKIWRSADGFYRTCAPCQS